MNAKHLIKGEDLDAVLKDGVERVLELGYALKNDLVFLHAKAQEHDQLGTMGAGNHLGPNLL